MRFIAGPLEDRDSAQLGRVRRPVWQSGRDTAHAQATTKTNAAGASSTAAFIHKRLECCDDTFRFPRQ